MFQTKKENLNQDKFIRLKCLATGIASRYPKKNWLTSLVSCTSLQSKEIQYTTIMIDL